MEALMATTTQEPQMGLTFEQVWAALMETRARQEETAREMAREMKETREAIKETREAIKETDRQMKATDKRVGELTNRYGEISEHMIIPNLVSSFNTLGYTFEKAGRTKIQDVKHGIFVEIDALMENGDSVMVVEMKTYLRIEHIDEHVKRMEKLRDYADLHNDKRKYYGAIAGLMMSESEKGYALKKGFYILEPVGETFTITTPEGPGAPKAW
jgi:DNA gyrase/topoisomerase IV subunit A